MLAFFGGRTRGQKLGKKCLPMSGPRPHQEFVSARILRNGGWIDALASADDFRVMHEDYCDWSLQVSVPVVVCCLRQGANCVCCCSRQNVIINGRTVQISGCCRRLQRRLSLSKAVMAQIQLEETQCRADIDMVYNCREKEEEAIATSALFLMAEVAHKHLLLLVLRVSFVACPCSMHLSAPNHRSNFIHLLFAESIC